MARVAIRPKHVAVALVVAGVVVASATLLNLAARRAQQAAGRSADT